MDGRIVLEHLKGTEREGVGWIHLAQDRDQWSALVHMVTKLRVPYNVESFLIS
jgi:hypothetical protein